MGEIESDKIVAEKIGANESIVSDYRPFFPNINQTVLELKAANLNGICISEMTFRVSLISKAAYLGRC